MALNDRIEMDKDEFYEKLSRAAHVINEFAAADGEQHSEHFGISSTVLLEFVQQTTAALIMARRQEQGRKASVPTPAMVTELGAKLFMLGLIYARIEMADEIDG